MLLRGGEGRGEGGPGEEGGLQTGEEGENVVTGREAQVGMLDPVNSNTHQTSNPTRLLVKVLKVLKTFSISLPLIGKYFDSFVQQLFKE